jgi:hypothetical protein
MEKSPRLARRVKFLFGLVCGHCPDSNYTDFLCALAGTSSSRVKTVEYRLKGLTRANDYRFRALKNDGEWTEAIGFQGLPSYVWNKQFFTYEACSYCDDVFAEVADAVFMDAWLEEYIQDTAGHSLIVVRNASIAKMIENGIREGQCELRSCDIAAIIYSQKELVHRKKESIRYRMLGRLKQGGWLPNRQVQLPQTATREEQRLARQEARTIRYSVALWSIFRRMPAGLLPVYCWCVDRLAGRSFRRPVGSVIKRTLFKISKRMRVYTILRSIRNFVRR